MKLAMTLSFGKVSEARRALLRVFGAHFLEEGPFTLMANRV